MEFVLATCAKLAAPPPSDLALARALEALGARVRHAVWDDIDPAAIGAAALVLRSTWDYHHRPAAFAAWLDRCERHGVSMLNSARVARWNMDKRYLRELQAAGVPVVPTAWYEPGDEVDLAQVRAREGWTDVVVKPRVSATARGTHRVRANEALSSEQWALVRESGAMVQPLVPEVAHGESSLVYMGGHFSHAVCKRPAVGEFRVQREFGGQVEAAEASAAARELAERALAATPGPTVYARVDLVETAHGPVLMELELIEPELFLTYAPHAAERMARVLWDACARPTVSLA